MLTSAAAASLLGGGDAGRGERRRQRPVVPVAAGWWVAPAAIGAWLGRRPRPRADRTLLSAPDPGEPAGAAPARTVLNRLWPLLLCTIGAGALAFLAPEVPATAGGFAIIGRSRGGANPTR